MIRCRWLFCFLAALSTWAGDQPASNLLRNGSFEGGSRYWFETDKYEFVRDDAAHGGWALKIPKGGIQSAAFMLQQGKPVTISFSARGANGPATMGWQCTPCAREIGAKHNLCWGLRGKHPVAITGEWKRYSVSFTPNIAQDGFWPRPTFMLQLGDADKPILLDAVTIAYESGAEKYVPWKALEVFVTSPDLKGFRDESHNILQKGQTVTLQGIVNNPGTEARAVMLRWQLIDYEGVRPLNQPLEKKVNVPAGQTVIETVTMPLTATGTVLARCSVLDGGTVIDQSDLPLTSLAHPLAATRPDARERFGGSLFGLHNARGVQKIGFAWSRWHPHMNWADHHPKSPDEWVWFDQRIDELAALGISVNAVLYGKPKWAFTKESDQLPKDMQWKADDPRWEDLSVETGWDKFVKTAVEHYKGKSLIYEIENEPEFDGWDNIRDLYAKFTIRTARLIKQVDPKAKVMVDNVYGIPSGLNRHLLQKGAGKWIDIISWHDYHDGWLADATAIKRMRNALEELGCGHIEIWFNEGWAYTNTIVDEPAVALTHYDSAGQTNCTVNSIAELTANGQEKCILFHTSYEEHGMSFWDYCGPGTMLWDYYGYPLPLVPAWNALCYHIGLSTPAGFVRPPGANFCIFDDLRNKRGVMIAYADRDAKADVTVDLPFSGLAAEDCMGNPVQLLGQKLTLSKSGRTVFLYASDGRVDGKTLAEKMKPLDRKNASFAGKGGGSFRLPPAWEGSKKDSTDGNPALAEGKPVWRLDQVWPPQPLKLDSYRPLAWRDGWWVALRDGFGGQPKAEMKDSAIRMEFRAPHSASAGEKLCALVFSATQAGTHTLSGSVEMRLWENANNAVRMTYLRKTKTSATEVASQKLSKGQRATIAVTVQLDIGDELVILPRIEGMFTGGDVVLRDVSVAIGSVGAVSYKLPLAWEGPQRGTARGNPIEADGKALWRVDQVWPDNPIMTTHYTPLLWNGTGWIPEKNGMGGQPEIRVENGIAHFSVRGSWTGAEGQRIAGLCFIAPKSGVYRVSGTAHSKPWEGQARTFKLGIFQKDTQRASEVRSFALPRSDEAVALDFKIELTAGHELVFLPLMPDWHNATTITLENLTVTDESQP
ncbi:MAG TPA: carbohydrate binding domain-containing protein [Planctomycetota bacterium]|jgi:hypothetical protein